MKIKISKIEFTHDDLVNLLSTATYGSNWLSAHHDADKYKDLFEEGDCWEDKLAKILLNGGTFEMRDYYSEGELYGNNPLKHYDVEDECGVYPVTIKDFEKGIKKAFCPDEYSNSDESCTRWALQLLTEDLEFDQISAEGLMQMIMFNGEVIYG